MSAEPQPAPEPVGFDLDARVARAFMRFAGGFWLGVTRRRAWGLTLALALCLLASTGATILLNAWNRVFFDALENRDLAAFKWAALLFPAIIAAMAAIGVGIVLARETLQVRWRAWLVEQLLARWLDRQRYYHLNVSGREPPNPEYRISDDSRWATEIIVDLGIGLFSALFGAIAFISILWSVGGALRVGGVTIPAYMVLVALAYGISASALMLWIGRPLVGRVGTKNEAEGYFRFAMMRLRENAGTIAQMDGARSERLILARFFDGVVRRWLAIVRSHGHLTWITNASGPMIPIVPLLAAAPKYLAGDLTLGQVTQLAAAFIQVQIAISWLVDNYNRIAEWYASARRVMDIVDATEAIDDTAPAPDAIVRGAHGRLEAIGLCLVDGEGRQVLAIAEFAVRAGETVHISGASGVGKSTLVRVLAGLTAPTAGRITLGHDARLMIAPQRAYVPLGSLADALCYPVPDLAPARQRLAACLVTAGLPDFAARLDQTARWDQVLSSGERQRLGIARLMVHAPDIAILDDALSALDESAQADLVAALRRTLPAAAIVTLGQQAAPRRLAARELILERGPHGAVLRQPAQPALADAL